MRIKLTKTQKAFSLIEVIVCIVIIGIVSLTIPAIIKLNADAIAYSTLAQSVTNAKSALTLVLKAPYTCAYINDNPAQSVPMFRDDNDFYVKFGIDGNASRNFAPANLLTNSACNDILSIDKLAKSYKFLPSTQNGDFMQNFNYTISVMPTNTPFNEHINLQNYDTKLITISGKVRLGENNQTIRMYAIATNIGELDSVKIKTLK